MIYAGSRNQSISLLCQNCIYLTLVFWSDTLESPYIGRGVTKLNHFKTEKPSPEVNELLLQLTNACNLACFFCGNNPEYQRNIHEVMSFDTIKRMIDEIQPNYASFTGGEVTLVWDRLIEGLQYAKSLGIKNIVNTTLSIIDTEQIDFLINECGVVQFNVSFNDLDEDMSLKVRGTKQFRDRTIENIKYIAQTYKHISLDIETLLLKRTIHKIPEIHTFLNNLGVIHHKLSFMTPLGHAMHSEIPDLNQIKNAILKTYARKEKGRKLYLVCCYLTPCMPEAKEIYAIDDDEFIVTNCAEGRSTLYISAKGEISPCFIYHGEMSNISTSNVKEVWESGQPFTKWRNEINEECSSCNYWRSDSPKSCHNGCSSLMLIKTGHLKQKCGIYMRDYFDNLQESELHV